MLRRGPVSHEEMDAVYRAACADPTAHGARDAALLALFFYQQLKQRDLFRLEYSAFDLSSRTLRTNLGDLSLGPETALAVCRWLSVRGRTYGPLINPVRRPCQVSLHAADSSLLSCVLRKRAAECRVVEFSADDVTRTRKLVQKGLWHGRSVSTSATPPPGVAAPSARLRDSQQLVVRVLSRCSQASRKPLLRSLDEVAARVSGGAHSAHTLDWKAVAPAQLAQASCSGSTGLRRSNFVRNAVAKLVLEGVRAGMMSPDFLVALNSCCTRRESSPQLLGVADVERMIANCKPRVSTEGLRDAVLIALLWETGLPVRELLAVSKTDLTGGVSCIHQPGTSWDHCLRATLKEVLPEWLLGLPEGAEGVLVTINRLGVPTTRRMNEDQVRKVLDRRARQSALERILPATLRSSAVHAAFGSRVIPP